MQAISGVYDNGVLELDGKPIMNRSRVIVLFTEEPQKKMPTKEALRIFHEHAGSIKGDVSLEKAKDEYFYEKYGSVN
jgi:hypothetical protein